MFKRLLFGLPLLFLSIISGARAQGICPLNGTLSPKLVCVLPQVYGPVGLGSGTGAPLITNGHQAHFEGSFLSSFTPINEAIGIQVSQLPIASPSSGIVYLYDPSLKTFSPSTEETLGPIVGERAPTIGRRRFYVAFSYQYFNFDSIDGQNTAKLPSIVQHQFFPPPFAFPGIVSCPNQTGMTGGYAQNPCFARDFVESTNNVDITEHQYTIYATYGLTSRLDVSVAVPFLNVNVGMSTSSTIVSNSVAPPSPTFPGQVFHAFNPAVVPACASVPAGQPCLQGSFSNSGSATGIGDVVVRGKYQLFKGERAGFALGVDVRTPTGDAQDFLGSGAIGVKPFGVFSYRARVSPHADIGYEINGNSILAGDIVGPTATNAKGSLPNRFVYIVGADASVVKRLTASFDIYGQRLFSSPQLVPSTYTDMGKCSDIVCTTVTPGTTHPNLTVLNNQDINITNASVGLKFRVAGRFVVTGNVLLKLDDGGLRANAIPLVGASYSF